MDGWQRLVFDGPALLSQHRELAHEVQHPLREHVAMVRAIIVALDVLRSKTTGR